MMEIKLKQCPCCGTEAYMHFTDLRNDELYGFISCNNSECALKMNFTIKPSHILLNFDDVINGIHDVVDKWNRRENEYNYENKDIVKDKDKSTNDNIDATNYDELKICEIIYTKSSKCILDIGLVKSINPFEVYARCSIYNKDGISYYGYPEGCKWYGTGIYKTYNEWESLTMDQNKTRSIEEICTILGILYWQNGR